ncbi:hypothetical protein HRbin01_01365 [archaeon HR01]|nr:hypothetical protein HRbin01_01365 [archaeon HR01]
MEKNDIKEKLRDLVIEEEISPELVEKVKKFIRLTRRGQIVFVVPKEKLTIRDQILLYLLGKRLAKELEFVEKDSASIEEISSGLGADYFSVASRLSELKSQHYVLSVERGEYIMVLARLKEILDRLEDLIQEKV